MAVEPTKPAAGAAAKRRAPSALRSLSRWLLSLWWIFIIALGGSVAQYLGNHGGPLLATTIPQLIADVRRYPLWEQVGLALIALTILIIAAALTWLAWVDRTAREAEEADAVIADQKAALGQALGERVVPQLTDLSEQTQQVSEQAGEIHGVAVATEAKVDAVAVVTAETHDAATETRDIAKGIAERQNRPTPLPAGVTLTPVHDLQRNTFKLGDDVAANFPYIREPVAQTFSDAVQALRGAAARTSGKRGILVFGETNAGKTRLALESLLEALPDWELLRWNEARQTADIPPAGFLVGRKIALFIDDAQNYVVAVTAKPDNHMQEVVGPGSPLRTLWETLQDSAEQVVLIAICRSSEEQRLRSGLDWLFSELAVIKVPSFNINAKDPSTVEIIALFRAHGTVWPAKWNGTLGSLVLGLDRKRNEYDALARANNLAIPVLHAMKLLTVAGIAEHAEIRLRHTCAEIFGLHDLLSREVEWESAVTDLTARQLVTESMGTNGSLTLTIKKDAYFDDVVWDYPNPSRLYRFEQQKKSLASLFSRLGDKDALIKLGYGWYSAKDYNEVVSVCDKLLRIDASLPSAWYIKGLAFHELERYSEMLAAHEEELRLDPQSAEAWVNKGDALVHLERYEEALAACEEALRLDPQHASAWVIKGNALADLQRHEEALAAYEEALRLDPQRAYVWGNKGSVLGHLGRHEEALAAVEEALRLDPQQASAWVSKGNALGHLGRHEEALAAYQAALDRDPSQALWWAKKGDALFHLERYEPALEAYEQALRFDSQQAGVWAGKCAALRLLGRWEEALTLYDEALARNPDDAHAWNDRGYTLLGLKRYDEAVASIDRALTLELENSDWWDSRGEILLGAGRYQEAVAAYDEALARSPDLESSRQGKLQALQALAQALRTLGREDEARQAEEQARVLREKQA